MLCKIIVELCDQCWQNKFHWAHDAVKDNLIIILHTGYNGTENSQFGLVQFFIFMVL